VKKSKPLPPDDADSELGTLAYYLSASIGSGREAGWAWRTRGRPPAIAVLPFLSTPAARISQALLLHLPRALHARLTAAGTVAVRDFEITARPENLGLTRAEIAGRFAADLVLRGEVNERESSLLVHVWLLDAVSGNIEWEDELVITRDDAQSWGAEVAVSIVRHLEALPKPAHRRRMTHRHTMHREAFELLMEARVAYHQRDENGFKRAIQLLHEAEALDSESADIPAALCSCYLSLGRDNLAEPNEVFPKAARYGKRAIAIDPENVESHTDLGYVLRAHDWNWVAAEEHFQKAIKISRGSNSRARRYYSTLLTVLTRHEEAIGEALAASVIQPSSIELMYVGIRHYFAHDFASALDFCERAIALNPSEKTPWFWRGLFWEALGEPERALVDLDAYDREYGRPTGAAARGRLLAQLGRTEEARSILKALDSTSNSGSHYVSPTDQAALLIGLGELDEVRLCLQDGHRHRHNDITLLHVHPIWAPVRAFPWFHDLVVSLEIPGVR
jgi:tetratricopeptide (TPR) repeat protein/TolB-like protein